MELKDKHQAHGLTIGEMQELRNKRSTGEEDYIPANNAKEIKNKLFVQYENHNIREVEKNHYHVAMELPSYDRTTGDKLSKARVNKYTPQAFEETKKRTGFNGYEMHILHNPTKKDVKSVDQDSDKGLTVITGIGKGKAEKLNDLNIFTVQDLAEISEEKVTSILANGTFSEIELLSWIDQAKKSK